MTHSAKSSICALLCAFSSAANGASTFITVGVYDENTVKANTVDTDTGSTLGSFTADVLAAFNNNRGGVIDFQTGFTNSGTNTGIGTSFTAGYGGGAKTLGFTSTGDLLVYHDNTAGQVSTISDSNNLLPNTNITTFTLTLGPITGGEPDEVVSQIALTVLSRSVWGTSPVSITANFSGGGSTNIVSSISNVIGADDTFFHFVAPAGQSITSLALDNAGGGGNANQNRIPVDDLAFITTVIPEPSAALLVFLGAALGLVRRRDPQ